MNSGLKNSTETKIRSDLSQKVTSEFHRKDLKCEILQNGEVSVNNLGQMFVEYKPQKIEYLPNGEINENDNLGKYSCQADSYPDAKISYEELIDHFPEGKLTFIIIISLFYY